VTILYVYYHFTFRNDAIVYVCVFFFSAGLIMHEHDMQMWRPPYPSENLKTPRFAKTYSTTNPYATESEETAHQTPHHGSQSPQFQDIQESQHSKRENNSDKIYERGLTPQVGMNPFLQGNYLQDLETQNQFLKPLNSSLTTSKSS